MEQQRADICCARGQLAMSPPTLGHKLEEQSSILPCAATCLSPHCAPHPQTTQGCQDQQHSSATRAHPAAAGGVNPCSMQWPGSKGGW